MSSASTFAFRSLQQGKISQVFVVSYARTPLGAFQGTLFTQPNWMVDCVDTNRLISLSSLSSMLVININQEALWRNLRRSSVQRPSEMLWAKLHCLKRLFKMSWWDAFCRYTAQWNVFLRFCFVVKTSRRQRDFANFWHFLTWIESFFNPIDFNKA